MNKSFLAKKEVVYDLICLGGGTAGIHCALRSAELGKKVCIVEKERLGGGDLHNGTMLKYLMHNACSTYRDSKTSLQYGISTPRKKLKWNDVKLSWRTLRRSVSEYASSKETETLNLLSSRKIDVVQGSGTFESENSVRVDCGDAGEIVLEGTNILISTGGKYLRPEHPGIEHTVTFDKIFNMPSAPRSIIIIGGGYIASELACILANFDTKVNMCLETSCIVPDYDQEITKIAMELMRKKGITLCSDAVIANIQKLPSKVLRLLVMHDKYKSFVGDNIVFAGGREPNVDGLNLDKAGVNLRDNGGILVDEYDKTSASNIYALGDVARQPMLHSVARTSSRLLAERLFGKGKLLDTKSQYKLNYNYVPTSVLVEPPMAKCGYTEFQAIAKFGKENITVYRQNRTQLDEALLNKPQPFVVKVVCRKDAQNELVIGLHGIGKKMNEIISGYSIAMNGGKKGISKKDLECFMPIYTTGAEEVCNAVSNEIY